MDTLTYTKSVAESVTELMKDAGENLHSLSTKTGIPRTTLRRRVEGFKSFSVDELASVAQVFGVRVETLLPSDDAA